MQALKAALLVLIFPALIACAAEAWVPKGAAPGEPILTVATYNVNLGLAGDPQTMAAILSTEADVVFLQEVTPRWELAIRSVMHEDYPHMAFAHCCRAGGLAVLSRYPFESGESDYMDAPSGWFPGWRVEVDSPLGKVQVLQVHLHPPVSEGGSWVSGYFSTDDVRREEIAHFMTVLKPKMPALVLGDFNEEDGEAIGHLREQGFADAVDLFNPGEPTWRWPLRLFDLEFALDHVFFGEGLEPLRCEIMRNGRSDHFPIRATFQKSRPAPVIAMPPPSNGSLSWL